MNKFRFQNSFAPNSFKLMFAGALLFLFQSPPDAARLKLSPKISAVIEPPE